MDSDSRFGLTHPQGSDINILPASPLHSYLCVFRWFMLLLYHLDAGVQTWLPTFPIIKASMIRLRKLFLDKTGLQSDLPTCDGGTTSTGSITRKFFMDCQEFFSIGLPRQKALKYKVNQDNTFESICNITPF